MAVSIVLVWSSERSVRDSDVVIDADGATVCPGLIDSQVHWGPEICRSKPKHAAYGVPRHGVCACLKTVCRRVTIRPVTDVLQGLVQMRPESQSTDPKTVRFSMDFTSAGRSKGSGAFSPGILGRPIAEKKSFSPPGVRTKQNRSGILPWFVNWCRLPGARYKMVPARIGCASPSMVAVPSPSSTMITSSWWTWTCSRTELSRATSCMPTSNPGPLLFTACASASSTNPLAGTGCQ